MSAYHLHLRRVVLVIHTDRPSLEVYISQTDKLGVVVSDDFDGGIRLLGIFTPNIH